MGSQYQLKLKSSWLTSPTCLMWDLSNLLKCHLIKYLWQLLGIVHTSSQIILIIIVVNLVVCQRPAVSWAVHIHWLPEILVTLDRLLCVRYNSRRHLGHKLEKVLPVVISPRGTGLDSLPPSLPLNNHRSISLLHSVSTCWCQNRHSHKLWNANRRHVLGSARTPIAPPTTIPTAMSSSSLVIIRLFNYTFIGTRNFPAPWSFSCINLAQLRLLLNSLPSGWAQLEVTQMWHLEPPQPGLSNNQSDI